MLAKRLIVLTTLAATLSQTAYAKVYVNSMCTMQANGAKDIQGDENKEKKFPLASISKVVTTLWAVETLGANYRFPTKLHIENLGNDHYNVHIEGSRDPLFGRSAGYFLVSELSRAGIKVTQIDKLTFDENLLVGWNVEEKPMIGGNTPYYKTAEEQITAVRQTLAGSFATAVDPSKYAALRAKASEIGVAMEASPKISVDTVEFLAKKDFQKSASMTTLVYRSAPLKTILKNMNNKSNNYIADNLYWNLGGTSAFNAWAQSSMSLDNSDIEFYLGSGNNAGYIYGGDQVYSSATCETMIKVLYKLNKSLTSAGLDLSDVMAVAGRDGTSTVANFGGVMAGSTVAKTGSVNKAKTLSGAVSTSNGTIYFAVLMHTDMSSEWGQAQGIIKSKIVNLINKNGGNKSIPYEEIIALPFDKTSRLVNEANLVNKG